MRPRRLQIGSWLWKVIYKPRVVSTDNHPLDGQTDNDKRIIEIDSTLSDDEMGLTLFHEALHAALFETGHAEILSAHINDEYEESLVRALSNTLWPILRDRKLQ